nr:hypothetical protein [Streptomyces sp. DHE17-7]
MAAPYDRTGGLSPGDDARDDAYGPTADSVLDRMKRFDAKVRPH